MALHSPQAVGYRLIDGDFTLFSSFIALWLMCTAFSSLSSGFQSNFAYHFPESSPRRHDDPSGGGRLWRWLQRAAQVPTEVCKQLVVPAQHHLTRSAWIVCDAWLATLALAIVFKPLRGSWHNLLLLHHLVGFFALVFCQQLMIAALVQLVNSSYMGKVASLVQRLLPFPQWRSTRSPASLGRGISPAGDVLLH
jgi:hypothetical protein